MVHRVTVTPATPSIAVGETQQFTATAYDSSGTEISGKTFTWTSNDTTVANINSSGLATAVNAGSTTITAETDDVSGTASLTVTEPPICPMLKGSIADQTLTLGGSAAPIDLTQYFSLPVDFVPTYVVSSTDTSVTTTSLAGAMLTVTPAAAGTDTVSVTVSKQDCDSVKQSFVVTVNLPCPSAIAGAPIPDQTLVVGAGTTEIDLTQHFEHIDQDDIEITVTSPGPGIATAAIEGTSLKIDPVAAGQIAAIAVTVTDTAESDPCDPVSQSFMVTVEAAVEHPGLYPWSVSGEHVYRLNGNVGIGVEVPDQKLVVDGTVKAEGYRLRMIPADYVFEEGYDLLSLDEVDSYIRKHGHLPGVASGAEMKANGLGISRMQTTLLEKIEELSLYIIAQHEQLREQGDRLAAQQQKLEIQKTQVSELEQRLRRWER
ncbi:MAG: Ig domain-containing protein [Gemmatimonadetes bacterium]|nr:Ig domain-containing protein [Gemmatimonadota bacterium]